MSEGSWQYEVFNAVMVIVVYLAISSWFDRRRAKRQAAFREKVDREMRERFGAVEDDD